MTYADLKLAIADYSKRRDLTARIPDFVAAAHVIIADYYAGDLPTLVFDNDTNDLLTADPSIYIYGAVAEAATFLRDETLAPYAAKFRQKLQTLAARRDTSWGLTPSGNTP